MEPLSDPLNDRVVKSLQSPPSRPLSLNLMYPYPDKLDVPDLNIVRKHLLSGGMIGRGQIIKLVKDVTMLFNGE